MQAAGLLTKQLRAFSAGDRNMAEAILREVLPKLHQIAARHLQKERRPAPVSPTELINEVWLRHLHKGGWRVENREHFYAIAGCAMRRVLVEFARNRLALKRGGRRENVALDEGAVAEIVDAESAGQIVEIGLLMEKLALAHPESSRIVDLHYFAGFSFDEIAPITGMSPRRIRHLWVKGRDWLRDRMTPRADHAR
jgi:RNA polymerase sigma-70 factor, ECF subfamily